MYPVLLTIHSWLRWAVLLFGVLAIASALLNSKKDEWNPGTERLGLFLLISCDLQLVIGIILWIFSTPWFSMLLQAPGEAMSNDTVRFWTVEHGFGMIIAIVLVHIGRIAMKRAPNVRSKYLRPAIWFLVAMIIILLTMPWPFMPYGRPLLRI